MNRKIIEILRSIETENNVRILLACESGSRIYGFESQDSGYDIRFIFVRPEDDYLCLEPPRDVIEKIIPEEKIDVVGLDLKKALSLLGESNPSVFEWLNTPRPYLKDPIFKKAISGVKRMCFEPSVCFQHYYRMAVENDSRHLEKDGNALNDFLYYSRCILACKWIINNHSMPIFNLRRLFLDAMTAEEEAYLAHAEQRLEAYDILDDLLDLKNKGKENDNLAVDEKVVDYIRGVQEEIEAFKVDTGEGKKQPHRELDALFKDTVRRVNDSFFCAGKKETGHKTVHPEGEGFFFTYESKGQGCGTIGIGRGEERLTFSTYAEDRNPLRDMLFGLVELRDYHREEYFSHWHTSTGDVLVKMINKGDAVEMKISVFDQHSECDEKEYDWTLSMEEIIDAVLSAAKRTLRTRGIVGLSKDWVKENGTECDIFPFADFFALAGVDVKVEEGDIARSSFEDEFRILQQVCGQEIE